MEFGLLLVRAMNQTIELVATFIIPFEILVLIIARRSIFQREILVNLACALAIWCAWRWVDFGYKMEALNFTHLHAPFWLAGAFEGWTVLIVLAHIIVGDLCFYISHRLRHTKYLFLLEHVVHHSSTELNFVTNLRTSFLVLFYGWIPLLIPVYLGFNPALLLASVALANAAPFFMHTDLVGKLGWIEYVFNTPSHHRVHHASNPCYINKNFGGLLIIWDRLFGTYAEEIEPVRYGLSFVKPSANPISVLFGGWILAAKIFKGKGTSRN